MTDADSMLGVQARLYLIDPQSTDHPSDAGTSIHEQLEAALTVDRREHP